MVSSKFIRKNVDLAYDLDNEYAPSFTLLNDNDPEIKEKITWYIEYKIPFRVISKYFGNGDPKSKTIWKGNFYKCADETSHPHWLTWNKVDYPTPNFHLPQFFGTLIFE